MSDSRSLGEWLDLRLLGVDAGLAACISDAVPADARRRSLADGVEVLGEVAAEKLRALLADGCEGRSAAPELLCVDALVTYACELSAVASDDVRDAANGLLRRVTSVLQA